MTVGEIGEKRLLSEVLLPLVNPTGDPFLAGDDCGIIQVPPGHCVCASTDRVPWDLTGRRLGLMSDHDLGRYLAVLNISDMAAMGAEPAGLLLNLALPADFPISRLRDLISGVLAVAEEYAAPVLGGDLSDSPEPSLSATSLGVAMPGEMLRRAGAAPGDVVYTTGSCGLAATAMRYFLDAKPAGLSLPAADEALLRWQFTRPAPRPAAGRSLVRAHVRATAMDNTDGLSQSLFELAEASSAHFVVHEELLPAHRISEVVADYLGEDLLTLLIGPGADFHLVGTVDPGASLGDLGLHRIGEVVPGHGLSVRSGGEERELTPNGWNYFIRNTSA